jgi:hypothetical protein
MRHITLARQVQYALLLTAVATLPGFGKDETVGRLGKAATVLSNMENGHGLRSDQIAGADCVAVIPGFKKGAAVGWNRLRARIHLLPHRQRLVGALLPVSAWMVRHSRPMKLEIKPSTPNRYRTLLSLRVK